MPFDFYPVIRGNSVQWIDRTKLEEIWKELYAQAYFNGTADETLSQIYYQMDDNYRESNMLVADIMDYIAVWISFLSRVIEIFILTTLIVFVQITCLILQELKIKFETLANENSGRDISVDLDRLWHQYDSVCLFIEQLNRCYDIVLLVFVSYAAASMLYSFAWFFNSFLFGVINYPFIHDVMRFLLIVLIAHRVKANVSLFVIGAFFILIYYYYYYYNNNLLYRI